MVQNGNPTCHLKSSNQFRKFRKALQANYVLSIIKLLVKLLIVVFVIENYFLNFVSTLPAFVVLFRGTKHFLPFQIDPCFNYLQTKQRTDEFIWSQAYCQTKPLGLSLIVILPLLCASYAIYSTYWFVKLTLLTTTIIVQIIYMAKLTLADEFADGVLKYKIILQLFVFYLSLCIVSYVYEIIFKLIFVTVDNVRKFFSSFCSFLQTLLKVFASV
jgi:hypothetical protein